jgi:uncharacterized protein
MSDRPRYVFDTGVLVSAALLRESIPGQAFRAALRLGNPLLSAATIEELREVLARPKFDRYVPATTRRRFLAALLRRATIVDSSGPSIRDCRDPRDNKFLELAVGAQASCLVSGDEDLLVLNPYRGIPVLTPAQFLAMVASP